MEKIIVDPGVIPGEYVKETIKNSPYEVHFIGEIFLCENWEKFGIEAVSFESFNEVRIIKNKEFVEKYYNAFYNTIINDGHAPQLSERTFYQRLPWRNYWNGLIVISNLTINYLDYIADINPKFIFFHSTPHNIYSWVFGKVCELLDIPVFISKRSALPWRSFLTEGINEYDIIPLNNNFNDKTVVGNFIKVNSDNFKEAMSPDEKKGIEARKGKFWSWRTELFGWMKAPDWKNKFIGFISIFRKYPLYKYYQSLASTDYGDKFVVVFLHYQPERTSLPEGYNFTQQLHLIRTLRLGLPKDVTILVKEHPATFVGHFDLRYRIKAFYKAISEVENTKILDISSDSFSIIDNAIAVATMTGTAGAQALIRGISVLAFGKAPYTGAPDCYSVYNSSDVKSAFKKILDSNKVEIKNRTADYLYSISSITATGVGSNDVTDFHSKKLHLKASAEVFDQLLTNEKLSNISKNNNVQR